MKALSDEDLSNARRSLASLLSKSEKAQQKLPEHTWQHAMLKQSAGALRFAWMLMMGDPEEVQSQGRVDLDEVLAALASMASKTETALSKSSPGAAQRTLLKNRLKALQQAQSLVETAIEDGRVEGDNPAASPL